MRPRRASPPSSNDCLQREPTSPRKRWTVFRRLTSRAPSSAWRCCVPGAPGGARPARIGFQIPDRTAISTRGYRSRQPARSTPRQDHDQTVHPLALLEMGFDDFVDIFRGVRPVPDAFRIDHHQGTGVAETKAPRGGEADIAEPLRLDRLAHPVPQRLGAGRAATAARMTGRTLRVTGKDVMLVEFRQFELGVLGGLAHVAALRMPLSVNNTASSPS